MGLIGADSPLITNTGNSSPTTPCVDSKEHLSTTAEANQIWASQPSQIPLKYSHILNQSLDYSHPTSQVERSPQMDGFPALPDPPCSLPLPSGEAEPTSLDVTNDIMPNQAQGEGETVKTSPRSTNDPNNHRLLTNPPKNRGPMWHKTLST